MITESSSEMWEYFLNVKEIDNKNIELIEHLQKICNGRSQFPTKKYHTFLKTTLNNVFSPPRVTLSIFLKNYYTFLIILRNREP